MYEPTASEASGVSFGETICSCGVDGKELAQRSLIIGYSVANVVLTYFWSRSWCYWLGLKSCIRLSYLFSHTPWRRAHGSKPDAGSLGQISETRTAVKDWPCRSSQRKTWGTLGSQLRVFLKKTYQEWTRKSLTINSCTRAFHFQGKKW